VDALTVLELPVAVEKMEAVGIFPVLNQVIHADGCGDKVGSVGGGAYMMGMQVFVVGGNDHKLSSILFFRLFSVF
ncbi:MAG: hypothetical protein IKC46_11370, partial [Lachnospiraceae bacterium]|nr:hypothetical protein [Lachnospiraceae bacterium]